MSDTKVNDVKEEQTAGATEPSADVQNESKVTLDSIKEFLDKNPDDRHKLFYNWKPYQSELDAQKQQHLETWKKNNLEKIIKEKEDGWREEFLPQETPEQKRIRELERKDLEREHRLEFETKKNKVISYANAKSLQLDDFIINQITRGSETTDEIVKAIDFWSEWGRLKETDGMKRFQSQNARTPEAGDELGEVNRTNYKARLEASRQKYGNYVFIKDKPLKDFYDKHPELFG